MQYFKEWIDLLGKMVNAVAISDTYQRRYDADTGFQMLVDIAVGVRRKKGTIFLIGNGASASMASHVAADLAKNGGLRTMTLNDPSMLTAVGNDIGFSEIFSQPLHRLGSPTDILVAISSSGRSPNILNAIKTARKLDMAVVTFSAMDADNPLRQSGDLNFYIAADNYGHAESGHAALLHYWIDLHVSETKKVNPSQPHLRVLKKDAAS